MRRPARQLPNQDSQLPNLWALFAALAGNSTGGRQRDRSNTVLATVLVLCCSGHLPKQQLLSLLGGFL